MAEQYNSAYLGAQIDMAVARAMTALQPAAQTFEDAQKTQIRENINAQEKLSGTEGQVVGFDADGNAVAQDGVETDATLSVEGAAADAAAAGEKIAAAQTTADTAVANAATAQSTADTAKTNAATAQTTADTAKTNAATAQTTADTASTAAFLAMPGSLKWDGVIGDREYVTVEESGEFLNCLVRISDEVPDMALVMQFGAGIYEISNIAGIETAENTQITDVLGDGTIYVVANGFFIVTQDNVTLDTLTFPKAGIYAFAYSPLPAGMDIGYIWASALYILGYTFPDASTADAYFEKETIATDLGDTITWDGNTTGLTVLEDVFYRVSKATPTVEDFADGCTIVYTNSDGEKTEVTFAAENISQTDNGIISFEVAVVISADNTIGVGAGIYFVNDSSTGTVVQSLTIPGYSFTSAGETATIKTEHLPEALRFGEMTAKTSIDWDGNTEGLTSILDFIFSLYLVSEDEIVDLDTSKGGSVKVYIGAAGATYDFDNAEIITDDEAGYSDVIVTTEDGEQILVAEILHVERSVTDVEGNAIVAPPGIYLLAQPSEYSYVSHLEF